MTADDWFSSMAHMVYHYIDDLHVPRSSVKFIDGYGPVGRALIAACWLATNNYDDPRQFWQFNAADIAGTTWVFSVQRPRNTCYCIVHMGVSNRPESALRLSYTPYCAVHAAVEPPLPADIGNYALRRPGSEILWRAPTTPWDTLDTLCALREWLVSHCDEVGVFLSLLGRLPQIIELLRGCEQYVLRAARGETC